MGALCEAYLQKLKYFYGDNSIENQKEFLKSSNKDEKEKFKKPGTDEYYTHKTDMKSLKLFERNNFMDALEFIGVFNNQN